MVNKKIFIFAVMVFFVLVLSAMINAQIQITTCSQLQNMKNNLAGDYILANDIDCSATIGWNSGAGFEPVGSVNQNRFTGTFDGGGFTISNLYINRPSTNNIGLFGYLNGALIQNVGLVNMNITGGNTTGGLIGLSYNSNISNSYSIGKVTGFNNVGGLIGQNYNQIKGAVENSFSNANVNGVNQVGGLVGNNLYGIISNSYSTGSVSGNFYVGGLVGKNDGGSVAYYANILNSYSTGSVTKSGYGWGIGGLVGYNRGNHSNILNSYSTGSVNGGGKVGGLIGMNEGTIDNSYSTGSVNGGSYVGGLIGMNEGTIDNSYSTGSVNGGGYVGGLVGFNKYIVESSYSTGSVTGSGSYVGGLVGEFTNGNCANNFWDTQTSGKSTSGVTYSCGTGKTTSQMQNQITFTNWNFNDVWNITSGATYPCLLWQPFGGSGCKKASYNFPPQMNSVSISPSYPGSGNILKGFCKSTDGDSSQINYFYKWYLNNNLNIAGSAGLFNQGVSVNVANISGSFVSAGQTWKLSCLANDGIANSTWMNSSAVSVSSPYWTSDAQGQTQITSKSGGPNPVIVYLALENPSDLGIQSWKINIYEKDNSPDSDDYIKTITNPTIIQGDAEINSVSKLIATWTITQTDINKAKPISNAIESPYEFYFNVEGYSYSPPISGLSVISRFLTKITGNPIRQIAPLTPLTTLTFNKTSQILQVYWTEPLSPPALCNNNGTCDLGENSTNCPQDCFINITTNLSCSQTLCSDYLIETNCTLNSCNLGPQNVDCTDPNIECGCSWNSTASSCNSYSEIFDENGSSLGTCTFQEELTATCEEAGYLEYSLKAIWSGAQETAEENGCVDGEISRITCPAKTKLPIESKFGILLTILVIALIYLFYRKKNLS